MDKDDMKHGRVLFEALERVDRGGEFLKAADDELQNAVRLVLERGDSATVTIKLKISKVEKGGREDDAGCSVCFCYGAADFCPRPDDVCVW